MLSCKICGKNKTQKKYLLGKYQYYWCYNCQTLFLHPIPNIKFIHTFYSDYPYETGRFEKKRLKIRAIEILKTLLSLNSNGKTLLDIGSGYGYLLKEANKYNLQTFGIEPSRHLFEYSKKLLKEKSGLFFESFEEFLKGKKVQRYDFITLTHVLEHFIDPKKMINNALSLLSKDGILFIETPNINSWLAKSEKQNYTFLTPPDHIFLLSKKSIEKMSPNINILRHSTYSYPEHLMGIIKKKLQILNNRFDFAQYEQFRINNKSKNIKTNLKYVLFDKIIAPILSPALNICGYGSILELYINKW